MQAQQLRATFGAKIWPVPCERYVCKHAFDVTAKATQTTIVASESDASD
jgi:hypothetical protein